MAWLVPLPVLLLALFFWRLSFKTDDLLAAWCRFVLAAGLMLIASAVSIGIALT